MSIKLKLIIGVFVSMLTMATAIVLVAESKATTNMLEGNKAKLAAITESKRGEITNYLEYVGGLLTSLAGQKGTHDAFVALDSSWYKLSEELSFDTDAIKNKLQNNYSSEYIADVNYDVPEAASKRSINAYVPRDANARVAQYVFIVDNAQKLGEKNGMEYNSKYDAF